MRRALNRRTVAAATAVVLLAGAVVAVEYLGEVFAPSVQDFGEPGAGPPGGTAAITALDGATTVVGGLPIAVTGVGEDAPDRVDVEVLSQAAAKPAGIRGVVFAVTGHGGGADPAVTVAAGYQGFGSAYGGEYGARLKLTRLSDCALSTPDVQQCAVRTPVASSNDTAASTVTARVQTPAVQRTLFALEAGDASAEGTYGATTLALSSSWSVAAATGGFSWSYPVRTPPTPGQLVPAIGLAYSSQATDGRTAATNNQGSWIGEGFTYDADYVERRYHGCAEDGHKPSGDQCWGVDNLTIMLNGQSSELVYDDARHVWQFANDQGAKVDRLTGAVNGDNDGEHWRVTTTDGTEYYFGLNRLPGWASGNEETKSTWTVPVYGDDDGEPCYKANFAEAYCDQAWRWNLDYVKDVNGNVMSYRYAAETNYYARGGKLDVNGVAYHRGGYLKRIDYGQRDGAVYAGLAPARVEFDVKERCLPSGTVDCDPGDLTDATASYWPDVPFDRNCNANTKCKAGQQSPSFWTRGRLAQITTRIKSGTTYQDVDAFKLTHIFVDNANGSRSLWLSKIEHTGLVGGSSTAPAVELLPQHRANRVDVPGDNISVMNRPRLVTVHNGSGGQIDVTYAAPDCAADNLPQAGYSTRRCFPVRWNPPGQEEPITDWFHKYVVASTTETDRVGGSDDMVTAYEYLGDAAWTYAEPDGMTEDKYRTWGQWRGYQHVRVRRGDGQHMTTREEHFFLRGTHGDKNPAGGTRNVTVTDSTGFAHVDHPELVGFEYETVVYNGDAVVSRSLNEPVLTYTATQTATWGTRKASMVRPRAVRSIMPVSGGGWRETKQVTTYDARGRAVEVDDQGDVAVATDNRCTRTTYADNPDKNLLSSPSSVEAVAVACATAPNRATQVISYSRSSYDGLPYGAAPSRGAVTKQEKLASHDGVNPTMVTVTEHEYDDIYGRPTATKDVLGAISRVTYVETDGLNTRQIHTDPIGPTTTDYHPAWALATVNSDLNSRKSEILYDPLGRVAQVWHPDRSRSREQSASVKYTYLTVADRAVAVKTEKLRNNGSYIASYELFDGFLRPRQSQTPGPQQTRLVTDTFYNGIGQPSKYNGVYHAADAPDGLLRTVDNGEVDEQRLNFYDGAGRIVLEQVLTAGRFRWEARTTHDGDRVRYDPPPGGVAQTSVVDARGNKTEVYQHRGNGQPPLLTRSTYDFAGRLATVTDPMGNVWEHHYDQRGRQIEVVDPDKGTTTTTFDDLDRVVTVTDDRGVTQVTEYDTFGRRKNLYQRTAGQPDLKLASWSYDTVARASCTPTRATSAGRPTGSSSRRSTRCTARCAPATSCPPSRASWPRSTSTPPTTTSTAPCSHWACRRPAACRRRRSPTPTTSSTGRPPSPEPPRT
jgi:YD repeat-containing protein